MPLKKPERYALAFTNQFRAFALRDYLMVLVKRNAKPTSLISLPL